MKDRETKSAAAPPSKWGKLKESVFGRKRIPIEEQLLHLPPRALEEQREPEPPTVEPAPEEPAPTPEPPPVEKAESEPEPTEDTPPAALPISPEPPAEEKKGSGKKKIHGSETRQRMKGVLLRLTPAESAALQERASKAGLSVCGYLRACALGDAGPRAKRAPPLNRVVFGDAIAALNRVGNNVNQIAHNLNAGGHPAAAAIAEVKAELSDCLKAILAALGRSTE